ncbi:hypothetical protein F4820DRAFT_439675 [Hypoxylon rubiginosum]|uniref:Uncharacterized protein n=1 Tax=Hypoxylon rubiginosum TaxID=110542 RepID=A0ACB9YJV2_9PEZI|nr:hypothetical protein F4820DRAFT_439675 [Hypoxylon rubiginosum]
MFSRIHGRKSQPPSGWPVSVIQYKYNDPEGMRRGLKKLFDNQFMLKNEHDKWIIHAPRRLTKAEQTEIEEAAHMHY